MKRYTLSRSERERDLRDDPGQLAERIAEGEYDGFSRFRAEDFDLARESGAVAEVKSTAKRLSSGSKGRFRLFKPQHERLVRQDRDGSARYIFVLFDTSTRNVTARLVSRQPADIGNTIGARGGWNQSGHSAGQQHKLPIDAVLND